MKKLLIVCLGLMLSCLSLDVSAQTNPKNMQLPSIKDLPKEGEIKTFYEFDEAYDYKLYDEKGNLIKSGNSQFIDVTNLSEGIYNFHYNGQVARYEIDNVKKNEVGNKQLPSIKDLPKIGKSKTFYEFEKAYDYKFYDVDGNLLKEGNGQYIDVTEYPKGVYFINYDGNKVSYQKEN